MADFNSWNSFFKTEKENPTAYAIGKGRYASVAISKEIYNRDQDVIDKVAKSLGYIKVTDKSIIRFNLA